MGILEIHFHDSDFSWTVNPRGSDEKTLSFGSDESSSKSGSRSGSRSPRSRSSSPRTATGRQSGAEKLWMVGALALFVGVGVGISKLRNRRGSESAKTDRESSGRRLSLSRSK